MLKAEEIKKIINNAEFEFYGIRVDDEIKYNVGDKCCKSHQWWQDADVAEAYGLTDDDYNEDLRMWDGGELEGTCALEVTEENIEEILESSKGYVGDYVTLIAGDFAQRGNDIGEIIISDAIVLEIIQG